MSQSLLLALLEIPEPQYIQELGDDSTDKQALMMSMLYDSLTGVYDRLNPDSVLLRANRVGTILTALVDFHDAVMKFQDPNNPISNPIDKVPDKELRLLLNEVFNPRFFDRQKSLIDELRSMLINRFNAIKT